MSECHTNLERIRKQEYSEKKRLEYLQENVRKVQPKAFSVLYTSS